MFEDYFKYSDFFVNIFYYITFLLIIFHILHYSRVRGFFTLENYFLIMTFIIPILLMVPFSYSDLNIYASWDFFRYRPLINTTVFISCFGIVSFVFGTFVSRLNFFNGFKSPRIFLFGAREFWFGFTNKYIKFTIFSFIFLVFLYFVLSMGISFGGGRAFSMDNPSMRPVFNLFSVILSFFILYFYSYALYKKNKLLYFLGFVLIIITLFFGTRSLVLQPLVSLFFLKSFVDNVKITFKSLCKISFIAFICIYFAIVISNFRSSDNQASPILLSFLYGNNFSDIRDFAWVMYGWNGDFLFGKTELAGLLSFMPSFISDFRQTWSWGVFSTSIVGLNSEVHPGLRPGFFGESYINFGYIGVFLCGFISGFLIHKYDTLIHLENKVGKKYNVYILYTFGFVYLNIIGSFSITAGFFVVYVVFILMLVFFLLRSLLTTTKK